MWIYETKKSFQFEIQKLHVINKIKCLILEIVQNYKKLNFNQILHILLLFGMDTHKQQKLLLMIYFKIAWERKN